MVIGQFGELANSVLHIALSMRHLDMKNKKTNERSRNVTFNSLMSVVDAIQYRQMN